ncbi:hypothetical protein SLOPH_2568, partial [Spraguea lophii 42_110]
MFIITGSIKYIDINVYLNDKIKFIELYNMYYNHLEYLILQKEMFKPFTIVKLDDIMMYNNMFGLKQTAYGDIEYKKEVDSYSNINNNVSYNSDIDTYYSLYRIKEFFESFKKCIYIEYGGLNCPINKNIYIYNNTKIDKLINIHTCYIGYFYIFEEKCNIYLCSMDNNQEYIKTFLFDLYEYINTVLLLDPVLLSQFKKTYSNKNNKLYYIITSRLSTVILDFIEMNSVYKENIFVYFELYGMKYKTSNLTIEDIFTYISESIDIMTSNYIFIDYAMCHYPINKVSKQYISNVFVSVNKNSLIDIMSNGNVYCSLLNENICNMNYKTMKLSDNKINCEGFIYKINFYNPLIYYISKKKISKYYYPKESVKLLIDSIKYRDIQQGGMNSIGILNSIITLFDDRWLEFSEYRMEVRSNLYNIVHCNTIIEGIINKNNFFIYIDFNTIKNVIVREVSYVREYIASIYNNNNLDINKILYSSMYEVILVHVFLAGKVDEFILGNKKMYSIIQNHMLTDINNYNSIENIVREYILNLSFNDKIKVLSSIVKKSKVINRKADKYILNNIEEMLLYIKDNCFTLYFLYLWDVLLRTNTDINMSNINTLGSKIKYPKEKYIKDCLNYILNSNIEWMKSLKYIFIFYCKFLYNREDGIDNIKGYFIDQLCCTIKNKGFKYLPIFKNKVDYDIVCIKYSFEYTNNII